jgi:hypothetical protein
MRAGSRMKTRRVATAATAIALLPVLVGCGLHHGDSSSTSVFSAKVGECFTTPTEVKAQVSDLASVSCSQPHGQEAYALVDYATSGSDAYPGDEVLDNFAKGACAQRFGGYVGVDYLDSSYYYTYLTPSPRSWQESDRTVLCLVTDAGKPMVGSVKGADR